MADMRGQLSAPVGLLPLWLIFAVAIAGLVLAAILFGFAGTLVLAVVSPLVALYYHSSGWAGPRRGRRSGS